MGMAEPLEPQSDGSSAPGAPGDPSGGRADWLCGPEEGLEAERSRLAEGSLPAPKLFRPGADAAADAPAAPARVTPRPLSPSPVAGPASAPLAPAAPPAPAAAEPSAPAAPTPQAWSAAANSVPRLRRDGPPRAASIETMRAEFPMDDVDEHPRGAAAVRAAAAAAEAEPVVREHEVVAPSEFQVAETLPLHLQALEALRTNRFVQVGVGLVVVLLAVLAFMPRGPRGIAIREIRQHAERYDGAAVRVKGRVGEVFDVGGGYAFYLHQGRDTIVVFTRMSRPRIRSSRAVEGTVSTGYLDGQARVAIFEETSTK